MQIDFWAPIKLSIEIAAFSGAAAILLGILAARTMLKHPGMKGRMLLETIFLLPIVLPPTVIGFLLVVLFGHNSPIGQLIIALFDQSLIFTWSAAAIASIIVAFPLMYQSAKAGFGGIDAEIEDAARIDGGTEWKIFWTISIPLAARSLLAGGILTFARALGEFGATLMFAGNIPGKTQTMPIAIYMAFESGQTELAWAWVAIMVLMSFGMLGAVQLLQRTQAK
ncbi:molybdate ABC transporter permease subunit [Pradoshia sp.]